MYSDVFKVQMKFKLTYSLNRLKAALNGYDLNIIYHPDKKDANANALSCNPVISESEDNPELPRVKLYELSHKQIIANRTRTSKPAHRRVEYFELSRLKSKGWRRIEKFCNQPQAPTNQAYAIKLRKSGIKTR